MTWSMLVEFLQDIMKQQTSLSVSDLSPLLQTMEKNIIRIKVKSAKSFVVFSV